MPTEYFCILPPFLRVAERLQQSFYLNTIIHVKERKSIFPFPESCPIFLESERKAVFFGKGGKELERKGLKAKKFSSFPFLL